jgi:hypothetical protein
MKKPYLAGYVNTCVMLMTLLSYVPGSVEASTIMASNTTLQLSVFENSAGDFSGTVDIELVDANTLLTTFNNTSVLDGPVIESLHFESGVTDWISNPVWINTNAPGNNRDDIVFNLAEKSSAAPGSQNIGWAVSHRSGATSYKLDASSPSPFNGLNSGELLQIEWAFTGDFDMFISDINNGDSRFAVHIHDCSGGNSCSAVSAVPVPAAVWLFSSGILMLKAVTRRRNRITLTSM